MPVLGPDGEVVAAVELAVRGLGHDLQPIMGALAIATRSLSRELTGAARHQSIPEQPMLAQTRHVLDGYAAAGGGYREVVINDAGHPPFLEKPDEFRTALLENLDGAR